MTRRTALRLGWPLLLTGCPARRPRVEAGGATSFDPLLQRWAAEYRRVGGAEIDYVKRGSGYGVAQVAAGTLQLGVTDDPPTPAEEARAAAAGRRLVLVPLAVGAVAVVANFPGVGGAITLSGPVLADLFAGRVSRWDHPAVAALNPGLALPSVPVRPVVRAEASGTTATFAAYLGRVSPPFAAEVGGGRKPRWSAGVVGQEGSDGVAGYVERTPGCVGYVECRYARRAGLTTAKVVNRRGQVTEPNTVGAAASGGQLDADADAAYPITGLGYAVLPDRPVVAVVGFLQWAVTVGQTFTEPLDFAPLPPALSKLATDTLAGLVTA